MSITVRIPTSTAPSRVSQVLDDLGSPTKIKRIRAARLCARCTHAEAEQVAPRLAFCFRAERDEDVLVMQLQAIRRLVAHSPRTLPLLLPCREKVAHLQAHRSPFVRQCAQVCSGALIQAERNNSPRANLDTLTPYWG